MLPLLVALGTVSGSDGEVDFAREVRPILAAKCFVCHGPDAHAREAELRLDLEQEAVRDRGGYAVVDRERPELSELLARIHAPASEAMPPPDAEPLDDRERAVLEAWIGAGAPWDEHWAFVAPEPPTVPSGSSWARGPIDAFVEARLTREGLRPSPDADRNTLLRRVTLDLTGLPPTPGEIEAFLADGRADAYERVVDRLLASPHYGERMGLAWLDVARYADTNGYSIDGGRHMWAWRDWVIDAFNRNMPFDRFTVEQLAGDLLPDANESTRIASGFNRNHMITHEGGTIPEEYLVEYAADRVATTAQAWMGLTIGCARCHDHKYDPISQREYYELFAYFNSITDRGNDGNGGVNAVPFLSLYTPDQERELESLRDRRERTERDYLSVTPERDERFLAWCADARARYAGYEEPRLEPWRVAGPFQAATGDLAFRTRSWPELGGRPPRDGAGWVVREDLVDGQSHPLPTERAATYLVRDVHCPSPGPLALSFGSDDSIRAWWDGEPVVDANVQRGVAPGQERVTVEGTEGVHELLVKIVNYGGPGGVYFQLESAGLPVEIRDALAVEPGLRDGASWDVLRDHHRATDPTLEPLRARMDELDRRIAAVEGAPITTTMVMAERAEPRPTHVLVRGAYDQKAERVSPGTPSALPPLPADAPRNRLGLARWLVDEEHPLTARVAVNATWQMLFGAGLVETPEDFGTRGALPSHPELLDWLAIEFVEGGWDVKALVRRIVLSSTYRQDSRPSPELLERDPGNRLLARGPRFRLQAELIRDVGLAASGLLVADVGGPSARPYQPDGLWREMSHFGSTPATEQVYVQDHGDGLYRRGMYTIWKRTVPPPTMVAFDAPNREVCVVRRARTNTPVQALVLLNEIGYVEMARALAQRACLDGGDDDASRLDHAFLLVLGRRPTPRESEVLTATLARERKRFGAAPGEARALVSVGESPRATELPVAEHAAWTIVAGILLNLSETVTKS